MFVCGEGWKRDAFLCLPEKPFTPLESRRGSDSAAFELRSRASALFNHSTEVVWFLLRTQRYDAFFSLWGKDNGQLECPSSICPEVFNISSTVLCPQRNVWIWVHAFDPFDGRWICLDTSVKNLQYGKTSQFKFPAFSRNLFYSMFRPEFHLCSIDPFRWFATWALQHYTHCVFWASLRSDHLWLFMQVSCS